MRELNKPQKDYIENNLDKKSARSIARDLGCDRSEVSACIQALRSGKAAEVYKRPSIFTGITSKIPPRMMTVIHIGLVFGIALLIRLLYIKQLNQSYFFVPFPGGYDDYIFDAWAQEILKGNWLGDRLIYIYRMPLYVYFLSFVYFLFGRSYAAVYIIQSLIGSATCVVVYAIGRMLFSRSVGLLAGLMVALYGPLLFYTGMVVGEVLGMLITCLAFLALIYFQRTKRCRYLFIAGILIGLSMLIRGNMLIVLPFIIGWLYFMLRKGPALKPLRYIAVLCAGVIIAVSPIMVRNYIAEKDIVPITALGGLNIYIGNGHGADGKYRIIEGIGTNAESMIKNSINVAEVQMGRSLRPSEVSSFWVRETIKSIKVHGISPLVFLIIKKFALFWNVYELPDIWDYYFFQQFLPLLNLPLFSFLFLVPLCIVGAYMSWTRRRETSLLYVFIIGYMFSLVAIFITSRYRVQVVPFLAVFAASAIMGIPDIFKNYKSKFIVCAAIFLFSIVFTCLPIDGKIDFARSYNSLGIVLKKQGRFEEAIKMYAKASQAAPDYPSPYYNLGLLYRDTGRVDLAIECLNKAIQLDPGATRASEVLESLR